MTGSARAEGVGDSSVHGEPAESTAQPLPAYGRARSAKAEILKPIPEEHQTPREQNKHAPSIQVCRICGLVCEDEAGSANQQAVWITMKEYRARVIVPPTQVFFTHSNCPDCFKPKGWNGHEYGPGERTEGGRIPTTEDAGSGADEALIALADIIFRQVTKRA